MDQITLSLEAIAHIHALSYSYGSKHKIDWEEKFPGVLGQLIEDDEMKTVANFPHFKKNLQENNASEVLIDAVDKMAANYTNIFQKYTSIGDSRFLIHGDYWSNNVMFGQNDCKYNK